MPRLKLAVDALRVESFEPAPAARERGTVHALSPTGDCVTAFCPPSVQPCVTRDTACLSPNLGCRTPLC
jgi:hypothetical protein